MMDLYGLPPPSDVFPINDLLDLSNDDLFSSPSEPPPSDHLPYFPSSSSAYRLCADSSSTSSSSASPPPSSVAFPPSATDFAHELCVPSDYAAELEWLSRFVDDSFADVPASEFAGTPTALPEATFPCGGPHSKRSRLSRREGAGPVEAEGEGRGRRCAHCASEKTPQWRAGPLGPKTLCNACGVRYKSGRLVPEYRPAASPTFMLTQHSNSHRKVMELRRQKEARQALPPPQQQQPHIEGGGEGGQLYRHPRDFKVC